VLRLHEGDVSGELVERLLLRPQPRARREDLAPVGCAAFVDPQQRVAHRRVVVGRPQIMRAAELAIPRMHVLVSDDIAIGGCLAPVGERVDQLAVFGGAMVLKRGIQPDLVADREEEVVVVIVLASKQPIGLLDEPAIQLDDLWVDIDEVSAICHQIERDVGLVAGRQVVALVVTACVQRRVDERLQGHRLERGRGARRRCLVEGARDAPAIGHTDRRLDRDLPCEVAGRVEHDRVPVEDEHLAANFLASDLTPDRRQVREVDSDRSDTGRDRDVKRERIDSVARPCDPRTTRLDDEAGESIERAFGCMDAWQPARIEHDEIAWCRDGDVLVHLEHPAHGIGRIDDELDRPRVRNVLGRRDCGRDGERHRTRTGITDARGMQREEDHHEVLHCAHCNASAAIRASSEAAVIEPGGLPSRAVRARAPRQRARALHPALPGLPAGDRCGEARADRGVRRARPLAAGPARRQPDTILAGLGTVQPGAVAAHWYMLGQWDGQLVSDTTYLRIDHLVVTGNGNRNIAYLATIIATLRDRAAAHGLVSGEAIPKQCRRRAQSNGAASFAWLQPVKRAQARLGLPPGLRRPSGDRVGGAITPGSQCRSHTNSLPRWLTPSRNAIKDEATAPPGANVSRSLGAAARRRRRRQRPLSGDRSRSTVRAAEAAETSLCRRRGERPPETG
jgi:hypothetical protein